MNTADITCLKMVDDSLQKSNWFEKDNKWYNRVYLCFEDKQNNDSMPINGFYCFKYYSLENAEKGFEIRKKTKQFCDYKNQNVRYAMIPICKWIPPILFLDRIIINWKLKNMYWLGRHKIMDGINIKR
jgi:hypothetical protein